jgi:hypothetical protein
LCRRFNPISKFSHSNCDEVRTHTGYICVDALNIALVFIPVDNFSLVPIRYITIQAAKVKNSGVKMLAAQGTGGTGKSE